MPLPAPYTPPWQRLGEDGVALLAWLDLKAREVWRRNRDGLLPVPAFWPRRWTRLFWPLALLVAVLVALVVVGGVGRAVLARSSPASVVRAPEETAAGVEGQPADTAEPAPSAAPRPGDAVGGPDAPEAPRMGSGTGLLPDAEVSPDADVPLDVADPLDLADPLDATADGGDPSARASAPSQAPHGASSAEPDGPPPAAVEPPESPAEREARRLRAAWDAQPDAIRIGGFSPDPASATLTLRLGEDVLALGAEQRQRLADRWRDWASDEGYSHLRLRDGSGRLWGRDAVVGRGTILLDPPDPPDPPAPSEAPGPAVGTP